MKIIATLGPKTTNKEVIKQLIDVGVDIFRLNFSHFYENQFNNMISIIRSIDKDMDIMADLQGKKVRVDESLKNVFKIYENEIVYFCGYDGYLIFDENNKKMKLIPLNISSEIISNNNIEKISMKDGTMNFKVIDQNNGFLKVRVINDGIIRGGKGFNIPGIYFENKELTKKDKKSLKWAIENNIKIISQSFVENKRDIDHIRKYICEINGDLKSIKLLSKIETNLGVDNFKEIIRYSDGIIIARGDLIPECGLINSVDKEFDLLLKVKKYEKEKEVIIATHILDNMRKGIIPNINELESIYTFVNLGVTGFLLASETSIGNYPVKSVEMLKMLINLYKK